MGNWGERADFFGFKTNKMFLLTQVGNHDALHYGNIVTYLRLNGLEPSGGWFRWRSGESSFKIGEPFSSFYSLLTTHLTPLESAVTKKGRGAAPRPAPDFPGERVGGPSMRVWVLQRRAFRSLF
jgi:hypothetical protein